jgi:hypothetical protein
LVSPELKSRWRLFIEGDERALPKILQSVPRVDLLHYDSDKSYSGRAFAVDLVRKKLGAAGVMIIDDIADNSWFREEVERSQMPHAVLGRSGLIDPGKWLIH